MEDTRFRDSQYDDRKGELKQKNINSSIDPMPFKFSGIMEQTHSYRTGDQFCRNILSTLKREFCKLKKTEPCESLLFHL